MRLKDNEEFKKSVANYFQNAYTILENQEIDNTVEYAKWINDKTEYRYGIKKFNLRIFNNFIYWANLGYNIGSEQEDCRPVLVVRTTKESTVCTIIPLTLERLNDKIPYHVDLENGKSTALVEQIRTISKNRIYEYHYEKRKYATITEENWKNINTQLNELYRLKPLYNQK